MFRVICTVCVILSVANLAEAQGRFGADPALKKAHESPVPDPDFKPRCKGFAKLAAALSGFYEMAGRDNRRDAAVVRKELIEAAVDYPLPALNQAARLLHAELHSGRTKQYLLDAKVLRKDLLDAAADIERRAKNGEYVRTEGRYDTDPLGKPIPVFVKVDDSEFYLREARKMRARAEKTDAELVAEARRKIEKESARLSQILTIKSLQGVARQAEKNAGPKSSSPLIRVLRNDTTTFRLRNGKRKLTDVSVFLGFHHARSPEGKSYVTFQTYYFVPVWNPNEEITLTPARPPRKSEVTRTFLTVYANEASQLNEIGFHPDPNGRRFVPARENAAVDSPEGAAKDRLAAAMTLAKQGKFDEARIALEKIVADHPNTNWETAAKLALSRLNAMKQGRDRAKELRRRLGVPRR